MCEKGALNLTRLGSIEAGALGGLFEAWDDERGLLIITSDHGNIEDKTHFMVDKQAD